MDLGKLRKDLSRRTFEVPDQSFRFECTSLRPFTRFYVIVDQLDFTQFCVQDGKRMSDPLISDGYGKLNFTFYWTKYNQSDAPDNMQFQKLFETTVGNKIVSVVDKSGTCGATKTVYFTSNSPDVMFSRYTNASNIILNS